MRISQQAAFHIEDFEETKIDKEGKILKVRATEYYMDEGIRVRQQFEKRGHAVDSTRYVAVGVLESEYENYTKK